MKVEVEVSKEGYELITGIASAIKKIKMEVDDNGGWDMADDLSGIIAAAVTDLLPALEGSMKIKEEFENDRTALMKGIILGSTELVEVFIPKKEEEKTEEEQS